MFLQRKVWYVLNYNGSSLIWIGISIPLTVDECRNNLDEPCRMCSSERATYRAGKRWFFNISRISIMCNKYVDYLINAPRICILKSKYLIRKLQKQHKYRFGNYPSWTKYNFKVFFARAHFRIYLHVVTTKKHMFMLDNCIVE